jgi:hypothetical protein
MKLVQTSVPMKSAMKHLQSECSEVANEETFVGVDILKDMTLDESIIE